MKQTKQNAAGVKLYVPDEFDIKLWKDDEGRQNMIYTETVNNIPENEIEHATNMTKIAVEKFFQSINGMADFKIESNINGTKVNITIYASGKEEVIYTYVVSELIGRSMFGKFSIGQMMMMFLDIPFEQAIAELAVRKMLGQFVSVVKGGE